MTQQQLVLTRVNKDKNDAGDQDETIPHKRAAAERHVVDLLGEPGFEAQSWGYLIAYESGRSLSAEGDPSKYLGSMVDRALLAQVLRLDDSARRELRAVIDDSLDDGYLQPDVAAVIDRRIAEADAAPGDNVTIDVDERQVLSHRQNPAQPD